MASTADAAARRAATAASIEVRARLGAPAVRLDDDKAVDLRLEVGQDAAQRHQQVVHRGAQQQKRRVEHRGSSARSAAARRVAAGGAERLRRLSA